MVDREGGRKLMRAFLGISRGNSADGAGGADWDGVMDRDGVMNQNAAMNHLAVPTRILPLYTMIERLLALEEENWFDYAWSREPLAGRFSREQKLAYAVRAAACGRCEGELLLRDMEGTALRKIAVNMGLTVSAPRIPNGGGHVIFAQYQEPDSITIFMESADKARALIEKEGLRRLLGNLAVEDVLLAHELFHAVEYRKQDTIYTQTEKVELWRKPFSNRSRLICLGEIAGMEFARRLTGISYTPYVLDVLMMYGYDRGAATALYEEIVAFAGEGAEKER